MKALLVIDDLPNDISIKDIGITYIIQQRNGLLVKAQVEGVPLKPMPERKYAIQGMRGYQGTVRECKGYNACIDEILGEEE